jgi:hypothetical protein
MTERPEEKILFEVNEEVVAVPNVGFRPEFVEDENGGILDNGRRGYWTVVPIEESDTQS